MVLTADEFDAMAVYQATQMPALALPNGCHNLSPEVCMSLHILFVFCQQTLYLVLHLFYFHVCMYSYYHNWSNLKKLFCGLGMTHNQSKQLVILPKN